jgi:peptidyl-prolyl cis-trans isomerase D
MAVLGKIRKRVGLLIAFIGISMLLFILGDLVTSNTGIMHRNSDVIGNIGGEAVHYQEFEKRVEKLTENYKTNSKTENIDPNTQDMLREQAWSMYVNDNVLGKEYQDLGISCSSEELYDMCTGKNPNPQIKQAFTDPKTGQFNPATVVSFLKDLPNRPEDVQRQWKTFEDAIKEERISNKYKTIIRSGLFVTTEEAKRNYEESQRTASIRYVRMDYSTIPDSSVKIDDGDLKSYYNDHKNKFKQAETVRKVEYVAFDILPSAEDREKVVTDITKLKDEFAQSTDNILFVNQNSDSPFDSTYHSKGTFSPAVDSLLFASPVGTIIGPMEDGSSYKLWKVSNEKMTSDSVKARHILLKPENGDTAKALAKADSLKNLIKKGAKFEDLARIYSQDQGSAIKGGDLGWFRQKVMVGPFNDACFNGKKGDMPIVKSEFGVHLIEILDKGVPSKQIQVAVIERKLVPSDKTYENVYNKASEFAFKNNNGNAFDSAIVKQGLNKRIADNIRESDKTIPGLEQPRELVRWAYSAKKGDISKVFTFGDKNVIAHLVDIKEKGFLPLEAVKDIVTPEVRKEKKADILVEKFTNAGGSSIDAIAQKLNTAAADADNILMSNTYIPGIGNEANVVGTVFALKAGAISKPIRGENSVTVVAVKSFKDLVPTNDYSVNIKQLGDQRKSRSEYEVFNALKEKAGVEDFRGKFY